MKFNTEGVKRGLMNSEEFGQMADVWPVPEIKRPLDCRNAEVLKSDQGVIDQGSTAEKFHYLSLEQMFLDEAHLFLQASRQNSFEVTLSLCNSSDLSDNATIRFLTSYFLLKTSLYLC